MKDQSMQNQVAVVTGAAGGIGSAICRRLAQAGARVVVGYRSKQDGAQKLANSLAGKDHLVLQVVVDDSQSCQSLAEQVADKYGTLDLLVNCAGVTTPVDHADLDGLTDEWIDRIFQVNWRGAYAMIRACKALLEQDGFADTVRVRAVHRPSFHRRDMPTDIPANLVPTGVVATGVS